MYLKFKKNYIIHYMWGVPMIWREYKIDNDDCSIKRGCIDFIIVNNIILYWLIKIFYINYFYGFNF